MKFCEKFKKLRKKHGYSQAEVANEIGVSLRTVQNWEKGDKFPKRQKSLDAAAELFGVSSEYLIEDEENDESVLTNHVYDVEAQKCIAGISALFSGGKLTENDKDLVMKALQDSYWEAKERARKKTSKTM